MIELRHRVKRGSARGAVLTPHRRKDGKLVVSPTKYRRDQVALDTVAEALPYLARGYGLRMSNPVTRRSPSLVVFRASA